MNASVVLNQDATCATTRLNTPQLTVTGIITKWTGLRMTPFQPQSDWLRKIMVSGR